MTSRPSARNIDNLMDNEPLRVMPKSLLTSKSSHKNIQGAHQNYQKQLNEKKWAPVTKISLLNDRDEPVYKTFNPNESNDTP